MRSEPADLLPKGYKGVAIRKGPEPDAPIIYKENEPCIMRVGGAYGRQSERDGGVDNDCPAPPERAGMGAGRGFYWGYPARSSGSLNKGGWIAGEVDGVTYSEPYPDYPGKFCGPASLDFDCRAGDDPNSPYKLRCGTPNRPRYRCGGGGPYYGDCHAPRMNYVGIYEELEPLHDAHEPLPRALQPQVRGRRHDDLLARARRHGAALLHQVHRPQSEQALPAADLRSEQAATAAARTRASRS